jgi:NADH/F420H2 dehydrogenase subunit C
MILFDIIPYIIYIKQEKKVAIGFLLFEDIYKIVQFLRDSLENQYKVLSCFSIVDYPQRLSRFELVYELLSLQKNNRLRLKTCLNENTWISSIVNLYPSANWWEREGWDLFGVFFEFHPDLRRLLTDYGFEGHPLRKDFPLCGYVDLRYDEDSKRVVIEKINIDQVLRKS